MRNWEDYKISTSTPRQKREKNNYAYYTDSLLEIISQNDKKNAWKMLRKSLKMIHDIIATPLGLQLEEAQLYLESLLAILQNRGNGDLISGYNLSLEYIEQQLKILEEQLISEDLFPHHLVKIYPNIQEMTAKKTTACDVSGQIISKGTVYLYYRPLIYDITSKKSYVLKRSMKVIPEHRTLLPTAIKDFEQFNINLKMCYHDLHELPLFQDISVNIHNSELTLQLLLKKRKGK